jgi:hypothetical protein
MVDPANETSAPVNPVTGSLKVTSKVTGAAMAGSVCPAA